MKQYHASQSPLLASGSNITLPQAQALVHQPKLLARTAKPFSHYRDLAGIQDSLLEWRPDFTLVSASKAATSSAKLLRSLQAVQLSSGSGLA